MIPKRNAPLRAELIERQVMAMNLPRETAAILQFPARERSAGSAVRGVPATVHEFPRKPIFKVEYGHAWYHEAALQQAEPVRLR